MTGSSPRRVWLLAGPPFDVELYRGVRPRLAATRPDLAVEVVSVVEAARGGGWADSAAHLAERVSEGDVVAAHGLAVPVGIALDAALSACGSTLGALVLVNGPLVQLDGLAAALVRLARVPGAAHSAFLPRPWLGWLRSSAGLRRAVNNPYAMDRDTVAALCGPLVADAARRASLVAWLVSLAEAWPSAAGVTAPLTLLWGDNDVLHPLGEVDSISGIRGNGQVHLAPGGRFAWPEEMPWRFADVVAALAPPPTPAPSSLGGTTTGVSRMADPEGSPPSAGSLNSKVGP